MIPLFRLILFQTSTLRFLRWTEKTNNKISPFPSQFEHAQMMVCIFVLLIIAIVEHQSYRTALLSMSAERRQLLVPPTLPLRLDRYLTTALGNCHTRSFIANLCVTGCVSVNGKVRDKSFKVKEGDEIVANIVQKPELKVVPENISLDIVFEDQHILAINKPAGMVVHPAVGSPNGTFVNAFLHYLGNAASTLSSGIVSTEEDSLLDPDQNEDDDDKHINDYLRPGVVHRLDKGTSGVLLAGKTAHAVSQLSALFASRQIKKYYIAVCVGNPGDVTIRKRIERSTVYRQQMVTCLGLKGKPAISHVRTLAFDGKLSVCLIHIETGRYLT